jgi:hypothetical protein
MPIYISTYIYMLQSTMVNMLMNFLVDTTAAAYLEFGRYFIFIMSSK